MKITKILMLAIFLTASANIMADPYTAILSCGMQGQHLNIAACFDGTDLKITKDDRSKIYKIYELNNAGVTKRDGIHISLPSKFSIKAQNSHNTLVLGIRILDKNNKIIYEDQAGRWGVINIGN